MVINGATGEKDIIEKFCLYEGEQILYECNGNIVHNKRMIKPIILKPANIFITNYRIIAHGKRKSGKYAKYNTVQQELPCYGYVVPIKNLYKLKKILGIIIYKVLVDNSLNGIGISFNSSVKKKKRKEQINTIYEILRKEEANPQEIPYKTMKLTKGLLWVGLFILLFPVLIFFMIITDLDHFADMLRWNPSQFRNIMTGTIITVIIGVIFILSSRWISRKNKRKSKKEAIKEIKYTKSEKIKKIKST